MRVDGTVPRERKAPEVRPVEQFLAELRDFQQRHHPKDSKIVQAVATGRAPRRALQNFAKEIHAVSVTSLRPFAALVANAPDEGTFEVMLQHFAREAGLAGVPRHPVLCRQFVLGTGVAEAELKAHVPLPSTLGAVYMLDRCLRGSVDEGIIGFGLAIEDPAPEWGSLVRNGLKDHYHLPEESRRFWTVMEEDKELEAEQAEKWLRLLQRFAATGEQQARLRKVFMHSALVFEHLFAGMDRFLEPA